MSTTEAQPGEMQKLSSSASHQQSDQARFNEGRLSLRSLWRSVGRALSSLKLAIAVIVSLGVLIAVGTFYESKYDANIAHKLVYKTPWMFAILGMLAVNLLAVMVDRWPWKWRHAPFLCAHVGILVLLLGSLQSYIWGVDGNLRVGIKESNQFVAVNETELTIWSSFDGQKYSRMIQEDVDFFKNPPSVKPKSYYFREGQELRITHFEPFVLPSQKVIPSKNEKFGAGLRFILQNSRTQVSEWIVEKRKGQLATSSLGPASIHLGPDPAEGLNRSTNDIFIQPMVGAASSAEVDQLFQVSIWKRGESKPVSRRKIKLGETLVTPWMGLEFKVLQYFSHVEEVWDFKKISKPTSVSTSALEVEFLGQKQWVQLNDVMKFFTEDAVYILSYSLKRLDLGFPVFLKDFRVGRYQGTRKAESYESLVEIPGLGERLISMNEPLNYKGFTLYQASFQESADGTPTASVFSVNKDPGRFLKYLGSLILSLGVVWLFYNKRRNSLALKSPPQGAQL